MITSNDKEFLWVEKYRPQKVDDCILPPQTKEYFKNIVTGGELQNLLLIGSAGVGKTSISHALCTEMGLDYIIINCSENGGIDTLRTTIRSFASTISFTSPYKVVILDESDGLSPAAQAGLRGAIEEFSKNCRFIFTANFKNKIIDPVRSRLVGVDFTFSKAEKHQMAIAFDKRVREILTAEGIEFDKKVLAKVLIKYFPDFRKVLNELQRHSMSGIINDNVLCNISSDSIKELFELLKDTAKWNEMRKWVANNSDNEFALIVRAVYDNASEYVKLSSMPQLVLTLGEYQYKASFVADPEINTVAMFTEIMANCEWK